MKSFDVDLSRLHNDSTSLKLSGAYASADGHQRGGKPTPAVKHGPPRTHPPDGTVLRTWHPELTELQRQVLDLLDIPTSLCTPAT